MTKIPDVERIKKTHRKEIKQEQTELMVGINRQLEQHGFAIGNGIMTSVNQARYKKHGYLVTHDIAGRLVLVMPK